MWRWKPTRTTTLTGWRRRLAALEMYTTNGIALTRCFSCSLMFVFVVVSFSDLQPICVHVTVPWPKRP